MSNIAIVAVGYNRKESLRRLISSISEADYTNDKVDLIISLDKSSIESEMIEMANSFVWSNGNKIVRTFPKRQGLRSHIIQCGDLTNNYDAVIVLEDDLIVSRGFYSYVKQCVEYYQDDERIAGISLYSFQIAPGCLRPFIPSRSCYDVFFMSFAQSWGQCWTKKMWSRFKDWYSSQNTPLKSDGVMPDFIAKWDDKSWLKYYMKYTAENNLFFVYPYDSLTTNFTESGEHNNFANSHFQVPLLNESFQYRFPPIGEEVKYDSFMERIVPNSINLINLSGNVVLDLNGMKTNFDNCDYLISTQVKPYAIVDEFGLSFRPQEDNVLRRNFGKGIFVYDMKKTCNHRHINNEYIVMQYDLRAVSWKKALKFSLSGIKDAIKRKMSK